MKPVLLAAAFVLGRWAFADQTAGDETADRAAIESIIATLNSHRKPVASLFTLEAPTADVQELTRLAEASREPLSEVTEPHFIIRSIRFVTPGVALVDAEKDVQYGSLVFKPSVPLVLVMKKVTQWRIAAVRVLYNRGSPRA